MSASDAEARKVAEEHAVAAASEGAVQARAKAKAAAALAAATAQPTAAKIGQGVAAAIRNPNVDEGVNANGQALLEAIEAEKKALREEKLFIRGDMGPHDDAEVVAHLAAVRRAIAEAPVTMAAIKAAIVEDAARAARAADDAQVSVAVCFHVDPEGGVAVTLRDAGVHKAVDRATLRRLENTAAMNRARTPEQRAAEECRYLASPYKLPQEGGVPIQGFRDGRCKATTVLGFEPSHTDAEGKTVRFVKEGRLKGSVEYRHLLLNMMDMELPAKYRIAGFDREGFRAYVAARLRKADVALSWAEIDFLDYCAVMWTKFPTDLQNHQYEWCFWPPRNVAFQHPYPIPDPDGAKRQRVAA